MHGRWQRAVLTGLFGFGMSGGWAQTRLTTVSLKPYGWMSAQELSLQHADPDRKGWMISGPPGGAAWGGVGEVVLDGQGHVYVGLPIWASGDAPKSAARVHGDELEVLVLNAGNGELQRTLHFPTKSLDRLDLRLAADGAPLVVANDKLMRLDGNGRPSAELALPNEQKEYEPWYLQSSTTGRTIRVRINYKSTMLVDAQTLKVLKRCQEASDSDDFGTMTDDLELLSEVESAPPNLKYGLERETFCEKRERLLLFGDIGFVPSVVDAGRFLAIGRDTIALRKLSGETVWTSKAPAGRVLQNGQGEDRLSRDGSRVAVKVLRPVEHRKPESLHSDTVEVEDQIAVWDVATGRLAGQAPIQADDSASMFYKAGSAFALSPDGRLLAVLQDGLLVVWKLE